jgi:hypothetical protein
MDESEILFEILPRGWFVLAATVVGAVLCLALLVLLLVSGGTFQDPTSRHPIPTGSCFPFCAGSPPPAPPPPGWS